MFAVAGPSFPYLVHLGHPFYLKGLRVRNGQWR